MRPAYDEIVPPCLEASAAPHARRHYLVSLSLRAASAHLYGGRLWFRQALQRKRHPLHFLPIVNDATRAEREGIDRLAGEINSHYYGQMTAHYVRRESLYASWNRALARADAPYFAPWNADDIRAAEAFIAGYRALKSGADLVDFPFTAVTLGEAPRALAA